MPSCRHIGVVSYRHCRHIGMSVCRYIVMVTNESQFLSVSEKLKISDGGHKYPAMTAVGRFLEWTGMECCAMVKSGGFRLCSLANPMYTASIKA